MDSKTIIRTEKRDNPYVLIDKMFLSDDRLSWKAKGLLAYFLSKPSDWRIYVSDLVKQSKDGRDAVYAGLSELEKYGYLERRKLRDSKGKITGWESVVYERPINADPDPDFPEMVEQPLSDFPDTGNPDTENPTLLNNDSTNNESNNVVVVEEAVSENCDRSQLVEVLAAKDSPRSDRDGETFDIMPPAAGVADKVEQVQCEAIKILHQRLDENAAKKLAIEFDIELIRQKMLLAAKRGRIIEKIGGWLIEACRQDWKDYSLPKGRVPKGRVKKPLKPAAKKDKYAGLVANAP